LIWTSFTTWTMRGLHRRDQHAADEGEESQPPAGHVAVEQAAQQVAADQEGEHQPDGVAALAELAPATAYRQRRRQQQQAQTGKPGSQREIQPAAVAADHALVAIAHFDGATEGVAAESQAERMSRRWPAMPDACPGGAGIGRFFQDGPPDGVVGRVAGSQVCQ
jgi:hypothetical protein